MNRKSNDLSFSVQIVNTIVLVFFLSILNPLKSYGDSLMNKKCENKPNCVSSFDTRDKFFYPAIENVVGPWEQIKSKIEKIMIKNFNSSLETSEANYIHFVVKTKFFRFKDDVYFWWDSETQKLNMKSQSRVGYSDLGANKKRLNLFVQEWNKN